MKLETVSCYICGTYDSKPWASEDGYSMVKCRKCGLVYLNPRPSLSEIDQAARTGVHKTKTGSLIAIGRYSKKKVKYYEHKIAQLLLNDQLREKPCRWLDIGTGYGEFIKALSHMCAPGSELLGIEPSEHKVKKAKGLGIPVETINLSEVQGKFTHISLINVFSHLPNPIEFLSELKRIMELSCRLILVTGNLGDLSREEMPGSLYLPDHLSFAGEENVKTVLIKAGFKVTGLYRQKFTSLDNIAVGFLKNLARKAMGRTSVPLRVPKESRVRSLWYLSELCV